VWDSHNHPLSTTEAPLRAPCWSTGFSRQAIAARRLKAVFQLVLARLGARAIQLVAAYEFQVVELRGCHVDLIQLDDFLQTLLGLVLVSPGANRTSFVNS
jgi:hypothetical protein